MRNDTSVSVQESPQQKKCVFGVGYKWHIRIYVCIALRYNIQICPTISNLTTQNSQNRGPGHLFGAVESQQEEAQLYDGLGLTL